MINATRKAPVAVQTGLKEGENTMAHPAIQPASIPEIKAIGFTWILTMEKKRTLSRGPRKTPSSA
jgi:hypothetical protein